MNKINATAVLLTVTICLSCFSGLGCNGEQAATEAQPEAPPKAAAKPAEPAATAPPPKVAEKPAAAAPPPAAEPAAAEPKLPAPWKNADIGTPAIAGSAEHADGKWTVEASGRIWGKADFCHFVYRPYSGDVEIIANVTNVASTENPWAAGGVMIRQSLDANAKSAFMGVSDSSQGGLIYNYRTQADGNTAETMVPGEGPQWMKLRREGGVIRGYHSDDGTSWTEVDSITFDMDSEVYIGLAVTENRETGTCAATFESVSVVPLKAKRE